MKAQQFYDLVTMLWGATRVSQGASVIRFRDGKAQYLGRSLYLQVDNEAACQVPDCIITVDVLERIKWWLQLRGDTELSVKRKKDQFLLSTDSSVLSVFSPDDEATQYTSAEEIVSRPTIVDDFGFKVDGKQWFAAIRALSSLRLHKKFNLINVATDNTSGLVTLGTGNVMGLGKELVPVSEEARVPRGGWNNFYDMDSLAINLATSGVIVASYSENTSKILSPLTLFYRDLNATLVLSPAWK